MSCLAQETGLKTISNFHGSGARTVTERILIKDRQDGTVAILHAIADRAAGRTAGQH